MQTQRVQFDIAGIRMGFSTTKLGMLNHFKAFAVNEEDCFITRKTGSMRKPDDISISIDFSDNIQKPEGRLLLDKHIKWIQHTSGSGGHSIFINHNGSDTVIARMDVDESWSSASISFPEDSTEAEHEALRLLPEILFRNRILFSRGVVVHSSAIDWSGKGILFTAPSETGKSTQASMWMSRMGAVGLNDDRPAVRLHNGKHYVFGTPWGVSTKEFSNRSAPLAMIIVLEQAAQNSIITLSPGEAAIKLLPRCYIPYYDAKLMITTLDYLEKLLGEVPVYLLSCRPDIEAVELAAKCLG